MVLFIMLYKAVRTFESVHEICRFDYLNESYWAVLSCGAVYYAVQGGSNLWVCRWNPKECPFRSKLLSSFSAVVLFIAQIEVVPDFESVDEIPRSDHPSETGSIKQYVTDVQSV